MLALKKPDGEDAKGFYLFPRLICFKDDMNF